MNIFIENVGREDIKEALHQEIGNNTMLIQISDIDFDQPIPLKHFKETYAFNFDDVEHECDGAISNIQAEEIALLLRRAKTQNMNVVVHCHAGLCRSGAIVECDQFLGFKVIEHLRIPNALVQKKVMLALGVDAAPEVRTYVQDFYNREFD